MIFISAQPSDFYFQWQIEVQIVNFRQFGISSKMHVLVFFQENRREELKGWEELSTKYPEVKFFFYSDKGVILDLYISQLRPHILKQHFERFPDLKNEIFFYHDSDIIFNRLPDFNTLSEGSICWQSDTSGYLDYTYLSVKEKEGGIPDNQAIKMMADIGGISTDIIKSYNANTGGAQMILRNIDSEFWEDVEKMCLEIRRKFYWGTKENPNYGSINHTYFSNENAGFQSWCADMWAINFALWKRDIRTSITPELDFSWGTDDEETYNRKPIYHNAGVTVHHDGLFFKGAWMNRSPIGLKHSVKPNTASYMYVKAIENVR